MDKKKTFSIDNSDTKSVHSTHSNYVATQSISHAIKKTNSMSTSAVPLKIPVISTPTDNNTGIDRSKIFGSIANTDPNDLSQIRENSRTVDDVSDNVVFVDDVMAQLSGIKVLFINIYPYIPTNMLIYIIFIDGQIHSKKTNK